MEWLFPLQQSLRLVGELSLHQRIILTVMDQVS